MAARSSTARRAELVGEVVLAAGEQVAAGDGLVEQGLGLGGPGPSRAGVHSDEAAGMAGEVALVGVHGPRRAAGW